MNTVRIADRTIFINGKAAGRIEGTSREVWLMGQTAEQPRAFVARFKYFKPGTKARSFIKKVFAVLTMEQYLEALKEHRSPHGVAQSIGVEY